MNKTFKNTAYSLLWSAMIAILVHGIIPHHHHQGLEGIHHACCKVLSQEELNCHNHGHGLLSFHHQTKNSEHCDECHFKTEFFYKKSIKVQDLQSDKSKSFSLNISNSIVKGYSFFYSNLYLSSYQFISQSRGPPANIA